jgi:beta-lactamase regulating signal transducer with metallopeptidase domain
MSKKKNKKKIKRLIRARALEEAQKQPVATPANTPQAPLQQTQSQQIAPQANRTTQEPNPVKGEIKKILITIGLILAVIIAVYFVNQKTDLVLKAGKYLTKIFNINL